MDINGKTYRLKSRGRFMIFVALTILLLVTMVNTVFGCNNANSLTSQNYLEVQVESGDTLWNIASQHMSDYMDTRKAVYTICRINDVSADSLQPGQVLLVPVIEI